MLNNFNNISEGIKFSLELLKHYGETVTTESWQGVKQEVKMYEYLNVYWSAHIPNDEKTLREQTKASMPWADEHFNERVKGEPLNPGQTYKIWPWYKDKDFNDKNFRNVDDKFSHTYMERYWPKFAYDGAIQQQGSNKVGRALVGIRYEYGDLYDAVALLRKEPYTRQAYVPIWFPEDTGVLHGGRVPCSLGYHFIMRNNKLNIHYTIRACDVIKHFRNDIYLTCRLAQWVLGELKQGYSMIWDNVTLGLITFDCISLHCFDQEKNLI